MTSSCGWPAGPAAARCAPSRRPGTWHPTRPGRCGWSRATSRSAPASSPPTCGWRPRSVTDVVDALEERGLCERTPDPTDRRATVVTLTASGRGLVDEIDAARRADPSAYFSQLSERDQADPAPHPDPRWTPPD